MFFLHPFGTGQIIQQQHKGENSTLINIWIRVVTQQEQLSVKYFTQYTSHQDILFLWTQVHIPNVIIYAR